MTGVILTGGKVDSTLSQLYGDIPSGLIPVNGKPVISHILQQFFDLNVDDIYIAVGYKAELITEILEANFPFRSQQFKYIAVDYHKGPGNSLLTVLDHINNGPVLINLGDTIVGDLKQNLSKYSNDNIVFTSLQVEDTERWCTVQLQTDREIISFTEKSEITDPVEVVVGVYMLNDISFAKDQKKLIPLVNIPDLQISDLLKVVQSNGSLKAVRTSKWMDFGHIDRYQVSKKRILEARHFNTLEFDDFAGTITKRSSNTQKFLDEVNLQLSLPKSVAAFFPRIIEYSVDADQPFIQMEYYGYPTVAELWIYASFNYTIYKNIVKKLLTILNHFRSIKGYVSEECYRDIYINKTEERINKLSGSDPWFKGQLDQPYVVINNQQYRNWFSIKDGVFERCKNLYKQEDNTFIHGDLCFSNILFDINNGIARLIDPRGKWGDSRFGDIKYDVAKLRHSISGCYDFIVNDCFFCQYSIGEIHYRIPLKENHIRISEYFDERISAEYNIEEIKLIEGLLFISMIYYHKGHPDRQVVMYARGIQLLNEVIG